MYRVIKGDDAWLFRYVTAFSVRNLARVKNKTVAIRCAICGGDRRCTSRALDIMVLMESEMKVLFRQTGLTIMYPTLFPHPWQQILCVRHSQVRGASCKGNAFCEDGFRNELGFGVYTEQLTGRASVENREMFGRRSRTA
jgi:hypothetical protein